MSLPAVLYDHVPTEQSVRWAKEKRQKELLEQRQQKEKEENPSGPSTSRKGQETTTTTTTTTENSADDGGDTHNKDNKGFGYYVSSMICQVSAPLWSPPENENGNVDAKDVDKNEDDPSHVNSEDHDENDSGEENDTALTKKQPQHEHEYALMDDEMDNEPPRGSHLSFSWLHQHPGGRMETILEADVGGDYVFVPPPSVVHGAINDDRRLSTGANHAVPSTPHATTGEVLASWLRAIGPTTTQVASTYASALWQVCWNAYGRNKRIFFHLEGRRSTIIQSYDDMSHTVLLDDSGNRLILPGRVIDLNGAPVHASTSLMESDDGNDHHDDVTERGGTLIVPASSSSTSFGPAASTVATAHTRKSRSWFGSNTIMVSAADLLVIQQQHEQRRQEDSRRRRMGVHGNKGEDYEQEDNGLVVLEAATGATRWTSLSSTTTLSPAHQWRMVMWNLCHRQTRGWYRESRRILRFPRRWGRKWLKARLRYLVWLTTISTQSRRPTRLLPAAAATTSKGGSSNDPSALAGESAVQDDTQKVDRTWVEIELAMWKDLCTEDEER